jgi:O-antigen/teichoic acid export membrane protein
LNYIRKRIHLPLKKNEQDLLWNFGSYAVMGICGVLKYFVIAAFYSPEVLGVYNQVYSIYMMVSQFSTGGVHLSTLKYVAQYAHDPKKYRIIGTSALLLAWFFALVTCVTLWLMRGTIGVWLDSANVAVGLLYAIPGLLFFSLNKVFLAVMNGLSKMKTYAIYQALRYVLMVLVIVIVAVLGLPGPALSVVFTIAEIILSIFLVVTLRSEISLPSVEEWKEWLRTHFSFGIRSMFSNVLVGLNPRVFQQRFCGGCIQPGFCRRRRSIPASHYCQDSL